MHYLRDRTVGAFLVQLHLTRYLELSSILHHEDIIIVISFISRLIFYQISLHPELVGLMCSSMLHRDEASTIIWVHGQHPLPRHDFPLFSVGISFLLHLKTRIEHNSGIRATC